MKKKTKKAYFVQRLIAFLIDILLVYTITSIVAMPFVDTKESKKVNEEINELLDQTTKQEITTREFADRNMDLSYRVARKNGIISLITLVMNILYFMVFQLYNKGQTIGKQIMKIRVKSDHGELTMNQMILDLITFMFMLSNSRLVYFYGITTFSTLQYSITLISIFMILIRKDGCAIHDLLVHTKVVKE